MSFCNNYLHSELKIIPALLQTKQWRKNQPWYTNGKKTECEKFQKKIIEKIINTPIKKHLNIRFKRNNFQLYKNATNLTKRIDEMWYTEDFDFVSKIDQNIHFPVYLFFNLKMICDTGGAQKRSIQNVHMFIECQLEYLRNAPEFLRKDIFFINILDGDYCSSKNNKMTELVQNFKYNSIREYIYVGDMQGFEIWYNTVFKILFGQKSLNNTNKDKEKSMFLSIPSLEKLYSDNFIPKADLLQKKPKKRQLLQKSMLKVKNPISRPIKTKNKLKFS